MSADPGGHAPAVSRADIEKAIRSCLIMHRWIDNSELVEVPFAIAAVCKELGIEAEQAVDPVEAKAREIATLAYPEDGFAGAFDVADADAKAAYRRIARHLVWQETGQ